MQARSLNDNVKIGRERPLIPSLLYEKEDIYEEIPLYLPPPQFTPNEETQIWPEQQLQP